MARLISTELVQQAQQAGYRILTVEQPRPSRVILMLTDQSQRTTLIMAQSRALIGSSDVFDLHTLMQLRRPQRAFLFACDGVFSPNAQFTIAELRDDRLRLCTVLTPANSSETAPVRPTSVAVTSAPTP
jgi:hypothetical protein